MTLVTVLLNREFTIFAIRVLYMFRDRIAGHTYKNKLCLFVLFKTIIIINFV